MGRAPSIAAVFSRLRRRIFPSTDLEEEAPHSKLGRQGERFAAAHLKRNGYKLLYRNFKPARGGEVDLVCRDKAANTLVFVEVKTRSSRVFGDPSAAVDLDKQNLIARGALTWLRMLDDPDVLFRFDIVEVILEDEVADCNLIRNAFQLPDRYSW